MKRKVVWLLVLMMLRMIPAVVCAEQVSDALLRQMARDDKNIKECLAKIGLSELAKNLSVRRVSLSNGGGSEYIVEPTGANPNGCHLQGARRPYRWVYGQAGRQYRLLLSVDPAEDVEVLSSFTKGYRDLKVIYPSGNTYPASFQIFTFDGMKYKEKGKPRDMR